MGKGVTEKCNYNGGFRVLNRECLEVEKTKGLVSWEKEMEGLRRMGWRIELSNGILERD